MRNHDLVPAAPTNVAPWVMEALKAGACERSQLLIAVDAIARSHGYYANDLNALKRALDNLRKEGRIRSIRKGWWDLVEPAAPPGDTASEDMKARLDQAIRILQELRADLERN
jgi:hypothetical protein